MSRRPPQPFEHLIAPMRQAGLLLAVTGDTQTPIAHLAHDSRAVEPDTCFFAVSGEQVDGHQFLDKSVHHGATAAVCERPPEDAPIGLRALAHVTDSRAAMAEAAAAFFGRPSERLDLLGITGTNGKTTTSFILHSALSRLVGTTGLMGTVETRIGDERRAATHTTPDSIRVSELLAEMVDSGCRHCVMEVSSHALQQQRVRGMRFRAGVFTNLTHEHLDYHGSLEAYRNAKALLFSMLPAGSAAVLNCDDPSWTFMVRSTRASILTFGTTAEPPPHVDIRVSGHVRYRILENAVSGLRLEIDGMRRHFSIAGAFNSANLTAAYVTLRSLGFAADETLDALAEASAVPGRLEAIQPPGGQGPIVFVDYAHTPDALENVLITVRDMLHADGALTVVFGAGGDRDRAKRPIMGRIAGDRADRVILTSDNPRSENPQAILDDIARGMARKPHAVMVDRRAAIHAALDAADPRDVIVIAGKGHEDYQILGSERIPFDDREVVRSYFDSANGGHQQ